MSKQSPTITTGFKFTVKDCENGTVYTASYQRDALYCVVWIDPENKEPQGKIYNADEVLILMHDGDWVLL